jgi:PBP1b-binding outer membrane lipoprotein LpoB
MNKKIITLLALTLVLASCGKTAEPTPATPAVKNTPAPIQIQSGALGNTTPGFAEDLNNVVEGAYQNAASGTVAK